jgi:hypothetical protein
MPTYDHDQIDGEEWFHKDDETVACDAWEVAPDLYEERDQLRAQLAALRDERDAALAEIERLKGSKFRKKPVVIEAVQLTESTYTADHPNPEHVIGVLYDPRTMTAQVETLEGTMTGNLGDWLITGVAGEHYFCKPDIFETTYEAVTE